MTNYFHKTALILFFWASLAACKKSGPLAINYDPSKQLTIKSVAYGSDPAQTMDVYLPAGRTAADTKIMIMVHGGSWESGDKADFDSAVMAIYPQLGGYAIFNINYRLAMNGKNTYPAAVEDVGTAIGYINSRVADYNVSTQKIVMAGASAGAHLAMLQAFGKNTDGHVKAVVDLFGPVDLYWLHFNEPFPQLADPVLKNFMGTDAVKDSALYAQASPINYITTSTPPTIIFHGTADAIVPFNESERLHAKLNSVGVPNSFVVYDQEGHGWAGTKLTDTYAKLVNFLNQYVH